MDGITESRAVSRTTQIELAVGSDTKKVAFSRKKKLGIASWRELGGAKVGRRENNRRGALMVIANLIQRVFRSVGN